MSGWCTSATPARHPSSCGFQSNNIPPTKLNSIGNFMELERPKERFCLFVSAARHRGAVSRGTVVLLDQQLQCIRLDVPPCGRQCICRNGRKRQNARLWTRFMVAQNIAEIDDDSFDPIKKILFRARRCGESSHAESRHTPASCSK